MGNCVFKGFGFGEVDVEEEENNKMLIKVVTCNGGIMELHAPITAHCITNEFPGHAIYHSHDMFSPPLFPNEELHAGESYHLLPLLNHPIIKSKRGQKEEKCDVDDVTTCDSSRSNLPQPTPYRMSFDNQRMLKRSEAEVFPTYNSTGVWKVKLLISPEQLSEILSHEARTEALIESVRTVAKCGSGASSMATAHSDKWSYSNTNNNNWKAATPI
ncbi:uncharacterized protein [Solanum tuberosum]|uniref:Uncharacterized protein n=1 Tax=Solanum tuberosum TaxID=4113 RepID=M1ASL2_SOLTU|nr:PREDICTED: uncharacterized protein LOC102603527 [Solanum tuberosum]KAH0720166.1 hypothetical protein KY284_005196 [Solanum tuberosum]KAH0722426.1 hypothetical protein KY289_005470 [Solanum tuberosum]